MRNWHRSGASCEDTGRRVATATVGGKNKVSEFARGDVGDPGEAGDTDKDNCTAFQGQARASGSRGVTDAPGRGAAEDWSMCAT